MYVCAGFSQLHAKDSFTKSRYFNSTVETIGLVHRIYQCKPSLTSPLLAASASQQSKLPTSVKPVAPLLLKNCNQQIPLSCPGTLNINGNISITNSDTVAITTTTSSLSDITVDGTVQIAIPRGGSFTIDGRTYTTSPIPGLIIARNSQLGVSINCDNLEMTSISYGVYISKNITLDVQGDITISNNQATSNVDAFFGTYGALLPGDMIAGGAIVITNNQATDNDSFYVAGVTFRYENQGFGATIKTTGSGGITMSGNQATSTNDNAYGVYNIGSTIITTGSGGITMSGNQATSTGSDAYGVCNIYSTIITTGSGGITMSGNQTASASSNAYGALISTDSTVKTGGIFTITVDTTTAANQNFGSAVAITNVAGTTPLPFSDFVVTVNGTVRPTYGAIPAGSVALNAANQS